MNGTTAPLDGAAVMPRTIRVARPRVDDGGVRAPALQSVIEALGSVVLGKSEAIRLCLIALLADGHVLIEDAPGLGKTTLARALARVLGLDARRIQFTSDLLPSDVTGVSVYDPGRSLFVFREGPIFTNVLLADEINRSGPRTQSALLEAMCERTVTADRQTRPLPDPFMVIATQNPAEHHGTYPLPDSELDRFLLRIRMGYPSRDAERRMVLDRRTEDPLEKLVTVLEREELLELRHRVREVACRDAVLDYMLAAIEKTRRHPEVEIGVSPRGSLMWFRAAQASAFLDGRSHCLPDDAKGISVPVLAHRMVLRPSAAGDEAASAVVRDALSQTAVPL